MTVIASPAGRRPGHSSFSAAVWAAPFNGRRFEPIVWLSFRAASGLAASIASEKLGPPAEADDGGASAAAGGVGVDEDSAARSSSSLPSVGREGGR